MNAAGPVTNLRIYFYGVQGSGSTFPSREERNDYRQAYGCEVMQWVHQRLASFMDPVGQPARRLDDFFAGPAEHATYLSLLQEAAIPEPPVYGGWTTCVRVESADGYEIVLDCGSGFRLCAADLQAKWGDQPERELIVLGTHSHTDHTEGFDQAVVCFDPRNHIRVYGNRYFLQALDQNLGIFSRHVDASIAGLHTPINFRVMPSRFSACRILGRHEDADHGRHLTQDVRCLDDPLVLGDMVIQPLAVCHPVPCLAYRMERHGRVFLFCTDHELRHGDVDDPQYQRSQEAEERLCVEAQGVDLLYRDGQFLRAEYDGRQGIGGTAAFPRAGWGHSCLEDVQAMAQACGVARTLVGHHDPNRGWRELRRIDEQLARESQQSGCRVELAKADQWIDL